MALRTGVERSLPVAGNPKTRWRFLGPEPPMLDHYTTGLNSFYIYQY